MNRPNGVDSRMVGDNPQNTENRDLVPYYEEMLRCTRCGYCLAACPTYEILRQEAATARGRIQLLRGIAEGSIPVSSSAAYALWRCVDCGACSAHCPGGVRIEEILTGAKQRLAATQAMPDPLRELAVGLNNHHNVFDVEERCHSWLENMEDVSVSDHAPTAYFVGCAGNCDPMVQSAPRSFARILSTLDEPFVLLGGEEWCCGYPLLAAGLPADDLIEHNVTVLESRDVRRIIISCPQGYYTWKTSYPSGVVDVLHSSDFLAEAVASGRFRWQDPVGQPLVVTYHDPCYLGRKIGVFDSPREILRSIPGIELREMGNNRESAMCCGGNAMLLDKSLTAAIAGRRVDEAKATGAKEIVTSCPQCQRILARAAEYMGVDVRIWDISELVWKKMKSPHGRYNE